MNNSSSSSNSRKWHLIDAREGYLGRLATRAASLLIGKGKVDYTPQVDQGDYVVVINAAQVRLSGQKMTKKLYRHYSGYPGGLKVKNLPEKRQQGSTVIVRQAVAGMLPVNRLRKKRLARLKIYEGEQHPHQEQLRNK